MKCIIPFNFVQQKTNQLHQKECISVTPNVLDPTKYVPLFSCFFFKKNFVTLSNVIAQARRKELFLQFSFFFSGQKGFPFGSEHGQNCSNYHFVFLVIINQEFCSNNGYMCDNFLIVLNTYLSLYKCIFIKYLSLYKCIFI